MRILSIASMASIVYLLFTINAYCSTRDEDTIVGESNAAAPVPVATAQQKNGQQGSGWQFGITTGFSSLDWIAYGDYIDKTAKFSFQPGGNVGVIFRTQSHGSTDFEGGMEFAFMGMRRTYNNGDIEAAYDTLTGDSIGLQSNKHWGNYGYIISSIFIPLHILFNVKHENSCTSLLIGPSFGYALDGTAHFDDSYSSNGAAGAQSGHSSGSYGIATEMNRFQILLQGGISQSFSIGALPCYVEAQYSFDVLGVGEWIIVGSENAHPTEIRLGFGVFLARM